MKKKINHSKSSQNPTEIQEKLMSEFPFSSSYSSVVKYIESGFKICRSHKRPLTVGHHQNN